MLFLEAGKFVLALLLLLGGIRGVSRSLQQLAGGKFHGLLGNAVSTPWRGFCVGLAATTVLQSSSLVTVMVVGFINGSLLTLTQGLGVIIGANLGTTITSQLFSLETGFLILPLAMLGLTLYFLELFLGRPLGGKALLSISVVLCGILLLAATLEPFADTAAFYHLFAFSRGSLLKGIITGTTAAAIIQSSSVTIGMVILMAREGYLNFPEALAIVVGADLGTCLTALLASIGTIPAARRVAWGHLFFNLASILLVIVFWRPFLRAAEITSADIARQVANSHALYNMMGAAVFLPMIDKFALILQKIGGRQKDSPLGRKKVGICRKRK